MINPSQPADSAGFLAAIVESSDDAIVGKSLDSVITSWNRGAVLLFGYSAEEAIGQSITMLMPEELQHEEEAIMSRIREGKRVEPYETRRLRKDGRLVDISVTISPILRDGKVIGASKIARDISEKKLAETILRQSESSLRDLAFVLDQQVQERTEELLAALKDMEGFTHMMSHDLRAPLRSINTNCRILAEDFGNFLPSEAKDLIHRQEAAVSRLGALIDDILKLSRIGRQEVERKEIDLSQMVLEIGEDVIRRSKRENFDIEIRPGIVAYGDPVLLRLALENLLENASKFCKPSTPCHVEVGQEDGILYVRDNGIGFEQQYAEKIFKPFERLHSEALYPGTGIGLANVRRIAERHGGAAWAKSRPGEGATFYMKLSA